MMVSNEQIIKSLCKSAHEGVMEACQSAEAADWVVREIEPRLKAVFCGECPVVTVPVACVPAIETVNQFWVSRTFDAVAQIVSLAVALYFATHGGDGGSRVTVKPEWFKGIITGKAA